MSKNVLLISNSTVHGQGYLNHVEPTIRELLESRKKVLFVPYALYDRDAYAKTARERFQKMDFTLTSVHEQKNPLKAIQKTEAIFMGGGNTFRLLKGLYDNNILSAIRKRVLEEDIPYIGSSAGSNVACPTIMTTNDMPIVMPPSFEALGLVSFQINPHYQDSDPHSKHMGETREERILQYQEENDRTVVGLREGAWLRIRDEKTLLCGSTGARIFCKGKKPIEAKEGTMLETLTVL